MVTVVVSAKIRDGSRLATGKVGALHETSHRPVAKRKKNMYLL